MTGARGLILLDTNIMIEAVRTGCWKGLRGRYGLVTVEKCREELLSGIRRTRGYVEVTEEDLAGVTIEPVSTENRTRLLLACPDAAILDDGEKDLWAHAHARGDAWEAACADQAAVRIAVKLGWGDRLVSLEQLVRDGGLKTRTALKSHYTIRSLSIWRTRFTGEEPR